MNRANLLQFLLLLSFACSATHCAEPELRRLPFDEKTAQQLQSDWARHLDLPTEFTSSNGMKLVLIPPGRFDMGPNGSTYRVTISKPFYLGATEVTLGQYRRLK